MTVSSGGWDTHQDNFERLKTKLLPDLDSALSGLFTRSSAKGLLETTAVFVTGEFGRTPKINPSAGRDHHPRAMFVAAGRRRHRRAARSSAPATTRRWARPPATASRPTTSPRRFYHCLGIDTRKEYHTSTGRPVAIVRNGSPIKELFA